MSSSVTQDTAKLAKLTDSELQLEVGQREYRKEQAYAAGDLPRAAYWNSKLNRAMDEQLTRQGE